MGAKKVTSKAQQKEKEEGFEIECIVEEAIRGGFLVKMATESGDIKENSILIQARVAGKLRRNKINIVPGDRVKVEVSPYDFTRGRITYRLK